MKTEKKTIENYSGRLKDLQEKFQALEPKLENSDTKEALSIIYGMLQETWNRMNTNSQESSPEDSSLKNIVNLHKNAPKMEGQAVNKPLSEGTKAPEFSLKDVNGTIVNLSDYKGSNVLIVFYPLDWSPGCSQQLDLYQNELDEFAKRGVKVIGISVDSIYSHGAWAAVRNIQFPLLADFNPKGDVAGKYNVYRENEGFSERALYLVDEEGVIRYSYISPYLHHVPDIYELFRILDEIHKPVLK